MTDLIAAAHGTADPRGIRVIHALTREIARQRPAVPVSLGFVDVDTPALPSLVERVVADSNQAVIVPLLLSSGYHVTTDIQTEAGRHPGQITAAGPLGPHPYSPRSLPTASSKTRPVAEGMGLERGRRSTGCARSTVLCWRRLGPPIIGLCSTAPVLRRSWLR